MELTLFLVLLIALSGFIKGFVGFGLGALLRRKLSSKHFKSFVIIILALNALKMIFDYISSMF